MLAASQLVGCIILGLVLSARYRRSPIVWPKVWAGAVSSSRALLGVRVVGVFGERCVFGIAVGESEFAENLGNYVGLGQVHVAGSYARDFSVEALSGCTWSLSLVIS